jgi:hypothetical protein
LEELVVAVDFQVWEVDEGVHVAISVAVVEVIFV